MDDIRDLNLNYQYCSLRYLDYLKIKKGCILKSYYKDFKNPCHQALLRDVEHKITLYKREGKTPNKKN